MKQLMKESLADTPPCEAQLSVAGVAYHNGNTPALSKTWSATFDSLSCKENWNTVWY